MDRIAGYESELNAGGPTRWGTRNVFAFWTTSSQAYRQDCICRSRSNGDSRVRLAPQSQRFSLYRAAGGYVEGAASGARTDGTVGFGADRRSNHHLDSFRALVRSLSNYSYLISNRTTQLPWFKTLGVNRESHFLG